MTLEQAIILIDSIYFLSGITAALIFAVTWRG